LLRQAKSLSGRVHAVGRTIDMEDLYGACDAVCSTALNDSRRLDVAAAMLCGVPCIATDVDAQRELLSEAGIAVAVGNAREVEAALVSLLAMPATERAALAQRGRQHVLQNYTVKRTVGRYQRLYEKLLDATPGAGCDDI
jgi:glycosyltransferase involved in cell wall biosynthesis